MQFPVSNLKKHPASGDASLSPRNISPFERDVVIIYKKKNKEGAEARFFLQYRFGNKQWRIFSDTQGNPLATEKTARKLASVIDYGIANKTHDPAKYQTASFQKRIFKNQIQKWLEEKQKTCKPTTAKTYETFIRIYINPFFGELDISEIKAFHGMDFLDTLPAPLSPMTKNHIINVLKMFLNYCSKADIIHKAPTMPTIKIPERSVRWADYETQNKLLAEIPSEDQPIFHFSLRHGLRICETLALMKKDINFQTNTITIERGLVRYGLTSTKTGKIRIIPIHPELIDTLKNLCSLAFPDAFIFTKGGAPYNQDKFYRIAQKAAKKIGLKISAYELVRHSVLSQAGVRLVDARTIQAYAGHSRLATTQKYTAMNALPLASVHSLAPVTQLSDIKDKK